MTPQEAIEQACSAVGIEPPRSYKLGHWAKTDTLSGRNGKGDGRLLVDELKVVGWNWQTGGKAVVRLKEQATPAERRQIAERCKYDDFEHRHRAENAARIAGGLLTEAKLAAHLYLARKGFPSEQCLVIDADEVRGLGGDYLVAGKSAIVMPARRGTTIKTVQLIWEDGTKKFLAGGETSRTCYRIAVGGETWLCEGLATGLSLRAALKAMGRDAGILCCFSASNVAAVARGMTGRVVIAADNDKPMSQLGGLGTGEYWARTTERPYTMPPSPGDFNDLHQSDGIYAVQRHLSAYLRQELRA